MKMAVRRRPTAIILSENHSIESYCDNHHTALSKVEQSGLILWYIITEYRSVDLVDRLFDLLELFQDELYLAGIYVDIVR